MIHNHFKIILCLLVIILYACNYLIHFYFLRRPYMNNFEFYNPTRIMFGEGKISELDRVVPKNAKVLILFGGESARKQEP